MLKKRMHGGPLFGVETMIGPCNGSCAWQHGVKERVIEDLRGRVYTEGSVPGSVGGSHDCRNPLPCNAAPARIRNTKKTSVLDAVRGRVADAPPLQPGG